MHAQEDPVSDPCPVYILVYVCSFLPNKEVARCVSRKWASAVQQLDLLTAYLSFDNAECINYYLDPLFDSMEDLASFRLLMSSVVDRCVRLVEQRMDASMNEHQKSKASYTALYNFVHANCKLFYNTNPTNWIPEGLFPWHDQSSAEATKNNSSTNSDFEDGDVDLEDDGFRYYADEEDEDEEDVEHYEVPRHKDDDGDGKRGVEYYSNYPDESAYEIAKMRDEIGYLGLNKEWWYRKRKYCSDNEDYD